MDATLDTTVFVLSVLPRDSELTCAHLRGLDIDARVLRDFDELLERASQTIGAFIVTEEAVPSGGWSRVASVLERHPAWSDVPFIVCVRRRMAAMDHVLSAISGNVTVIETPIRVSTMLSAAKVAVRARRRQYEVRDLLARLEETDRRKDEFLAMLGHELRNPLAAMSLALQLKQMDSGDAQGDRSLEVIERQMRNLGRIVDDLLDVSRVTLGKIRLEIGDVDLSAAARRCVQALSADATVSGVRLHIDTPAHPTRVRGDLVRIEQVLANLVTNAIKYTPHGGHVDVVVSAERGKVRLSVRDTGIGIEPDVVPRMFELFAQASQGLARSRGGLGLGLALVKRLVELHGGKIEAHSKGLGHGSTFTVTLPAAETSLASDSRPDAHVVELRKRLRVLLVEDNEDSREMLHNLLASRGQEVEDAADGMTGLTMALKSPPDVMVVDIGLPRIDGYQLARQVRGAIPHPPYMIAMTGYGQPRDRERALEAGFDLFMVKPVDIDDLERALARCSRRTAMGAAQF